MRTRIFTLIASIIVLSMVLAACGGPAATPAPAATSAPAVKDKIAVVMIGPWNDNSWNEAAYNALKSLEAGGAQIGFAENISPDDAPRVLRDYASQGFDVVIGHTFSFQDAVFQVAGESADVDFAWPGGINRTAVNVADYDQPFYQAAYPIGVLAGYMSKTGKLGALYGFDIPVCHAMGEALIAGAKTVNPDATLVVTQVGDWVDVAKAKEAALAQADAGVDFWIECGEGPALGAIEAAKERGGYVTGYVEDMSENGPEVVLVSLMWQLEPLFRQMLADSKSNTFSDKYYQFGLAQDGVGVKFNEALKSQVPDEAVKAMEQAIADIKSGKVVVTFVPE